MNALIEIVVTNENLGEVQKHIQAVGVREYLTDPDGLPAITVTNDGIRFRYPLDILRYLVKRALEAK